MKARYFLILLLLGFCIDVVGGLFKIQHWKGAGLLLIVGAALKVAGVLGMLYKLLTHPKAKDFLDR